jgi:hypothetical protein
MEEQKDRKAEDPNSIDPRTGKKKDESAIYLTGNSTLQSTEEDAHDSSIDPRQDDSLSVSDDDLRPSAADRFAGSDRAGTAERKDNTIEEEPE